MTQNSNVNPYPGPRPFKETEENLFFGREREKIELISAITAHQVVVLYAQSGCGKTSLLNACLLPALRREGFDVLPLVRVGEPTPPGTKPDDIKNIFAFNAIKTWSKGNSTLMLTQSLSDYLCQDLENKRQNLPNGQDMPSPRILIFDQFEEVFTTHTHRWKDRDAFFAQLGHALDPEPARRPKQKTVTGRQMAAQDRSLRVLFVIREDYLAGLQAFVDLLPAKPSMRIRIERLRTEPACEAVEEPAKAVGRPFEDRVAANLVEQLLENRVVGASGKVATIKGEFVEPIQLQVVCNSLLQKVPPGSKSITLDDLKLLGNVDEPLAGYYNQAVETTAKKFGVREGALRDWFEYTLITPALTRGMVYMDIESVGGIPNAAVDELQTLHLVRGEQRPGGRWYELTHDKFIEPIIQSNKKWRNERSDDTRKCLEEKATAWSRSAAQKDGLLDEEELKTAETWMTTPEAAELGYSPTLLALLRTSRAEIDRKKLEEKVIATRRLRRAAAALAVSVLLVSGMAVYAQYQRHVASEANAKLSEANARLEVTVEELKKAKGEADLRRGEAESQKAAAIAAKQETERINENLKTETAIALRERTVAEEQTRIAQEQALKAEKETLKAEKAAEEAAAAEQLAKELRAEAQKSAEDAMAQKKIADQEKLKAEKFSRISDARALAVAGGSTEDPMRGALLSLYSVSEPLRSDKLVIDDAVDSLQRTLPGALLRWSMVDHNQSAPIASGGFIGEGKTISVLGEDGRTTIWNVDSQQPEYTLDPARWQKGQSGSGEPLGSGRSAPGKSRALDLESTAIQQGGQPESATIVSSALSPNGKLLALSREGNDAIELWDVHSRQLVKRFYDTRLHVTNRGIGKILFSDDGKYLAVSSLFGRYGITDVSTPEHPRLRWFMPGILTKIHVRLLGGRYRLVTSFAFGHNGKMLAVGFTDGTVHVVNAETGRGYAELGTNGKRAHQDSVLAIAFSQDDSTLATAGRDRSVKLWRLDQQQHPKSGPSGPTLSGMVSSIAFSPKQNLLATASEDRSVVIWDAGSLNMIATLPRQQGYVNALGFSSDGNRLATFSSDNTVRLWDMTSIRKLPAISDRVGAFRKRDYKSPGIPVGIDNADPHLLDLLREIRGIFPDHVTTSVDEDCNRYLRKKPCPELP